MSDDEITAAVAEYERLFRERTPARNVGHVLAVQRVNFTDIIDWYWHTYHKRLSPVARIDLAPAMAHVVKRLRREFPDERWD